MSPLNGENSRDRSFASIQFSQRDIKAIKRVLRTGFNDVLLSLIAIAHRRYNQIHDLPLSDLRAIVPVSLRDENERYDLGNRLTGASFHLPLNTSITEQVRQIVATAKRMKLQRSFTAYAFLGRAISRLPANMHSRFYEHNAQKTNFICTNIPGPLRKQTFSGAPLKGVYVLPALMREHGIAWGFYTYASEVYATLTFDPKLVKDSDVLIGCLDDARKELIAYSESMPDFA
jgi:hypothetical protein